MNGVLFLMQSSLVIHVVLLQEILNNLCLQSRIKESTQSESQKLHSFLEGNHINYKYMGIAKYKWLRQIIKLNVDPKSDTLRLTESLNVGDELCHCLLAKFDEMGDLFGGVIRAHD